MKNIKYTILMALLIIFFSCEKEIINNGETLSGSKEIINTYDVKLGPGYAGGVIFTKHWFEDPVTGVSGEEGKDWGCKEPAGNCTDEIVVYSSMISLVEDLKESTDENKGYDFESVSLIISSNKNDFEDLLGTEIVKELINEKCKLRIEGSFDINQNVYLIANDLHGAILLVQPIYEG